MDLYLGGCQQSAVQYDEDCYIGKNHVERGSPPLEARQLLQRYDAQKQGKFGIIVIIDTKEREYNLINVLHSPSIYQRYE